MNEVIQILLVFYVLGFPIVILFWFASDLSYKNFKEFYFDNELTNELNIFGRFCYYILTSFSFYYYGTWIILSGSIKLIFLKKEK